MDWNAFSPVTALAGGALIGLSAVILLALLGRIAGVSGILGGVLQKPDADWPWRLAFLVGLPLGAMLMAQALGGVALTLPAGIGIVIAAGVLVGFGTRLGGGCTSGHGICGLARLSPRSLAAVLVFMASAMVTVFITHHVIGR
ncbi:MAG: YeeE/YedE family protein [Proteobacteria bacterium]|nr:YeeE/YedE family protein [Pseudomonadota bacterium]